MKAEPLSKELFDKLKAAQVTEVTLNFTGGHDDANLQVGLDGTAEISTSLETDVELWAWEAYSYSGAGDGRDYGDDIIYDLVKGEVRTQEWCSETVYSDKESKKLEVK